MSSFPWTRRGNQLTRRWISLLGEDSAEIDRVSTMQLGCSIFGGVVAAFRCAGGAR